LLTSLQVLASLGRNQCCLPCLCWSEWWSLRPTVVDDKLFFVEDVDATVLVKEIVHRSNSSLFPVCFMDAAKLVKISFLHFEIQKLFYSKTIQVVKFFG
jgi:hypothetical protein